MALPTPITSSTFPLLLQPMLREVFGLTYERFDKIYPKIVDVKSTEKQFERDVLVVGPGLPQVKNEGSAVSYDGMAQSYYYDYRLTTYGLGLIVTREQIEDNLYDTIPKYKAKVMAERFAQFLDIQSTNLYNNAFASGTTYGDGKAWMVTNHPLYTGGLTGSNRLNPDANISELALEQSVIDVRSMTDDANIRIDARPKTLMIPIQEMFNTVRIVGSPLQSSTAQNAVNALRSRGFFQDDPIENIWLSSTAAWFIRTSVDNGPNMFMRRELEFTDDNVFDSENMKFKGTVRFSLGVTDWRGGYGSSGS